MFLSEIIVLRIKEANKVFLLQTWKSAFVILLLPRSAARQKTIFYSSSAATAIQAPGI
jgi:hypothetical protein